MNILTVSREFGSGGRELGKRLADLLGCDYYDSEILYRIAEKSGVDPAYAERCLSNHGWKNTPISFRGTLASTEYLHASTVQLLLAQKKVLEEIAALGKDCVIVGRNADVLLRDFAPFTVFVCASREAKLARCRKFAPEGEQMSDRELLRRMKSVDKVRAQTRELLTGAPWGLPGEYHLTVNTTMWNPKELAPAVADFARRWFEKEK